MSAAVGCCATVVAGSNGFRTIYKPCSRAAKVERDGKWYCGQHDPQAQADRREKKREQWAIDNAEIARRNRLQGAAPALLAALETLLRPYGVVEVGCHRANASAQSDFYDAAKEAHAAVARAKGETT